VPKVLRLFAYDDFATEWDDENITTSQHNPMGKYEYVPKLSRVHSTVTSLHSGGFWGVSSQTITGKVGIVLKHPLYNLWIECEE
jgi:hypothetical protein